MRTADDEATKRQRPQDAPHENRDSEGDIVGDSTESNGIGETAWGTTTDLTPDNADETGVEGYNSGTGDFAELHLSDTTEKTVSNKLKDAQPHLD